MDKVFRFYYPTQTWAECTLAEMAELHMRNLPAGIILLPRKIQTTWADPTELGLRVNCIKHRTFEHIKDFDGYIVKTEEGCELECGALPAPVDKDAPTQGIRWIPMFWRVRHEKTGAPVEITVSIALLKDMVTISEWRHIKIDVNFYGQDAWGFSTNDFNGLQSEFFGKEGIVLPDNVTDTVLNSLRENLVPYFGFKPSVLSRMQGFKKIENFLVRPLDLNIAFLRKFIGADFKKLFPREATDNFKPLCQYLGIDPPKSMRKAYTFNPYAIVSYMLLKQWGVQDVNLIQRFYDFDTCIANFFLSKFVYFKEKGIVGRLEEDAAERWECMEFYFRWIVANKGEKVFVHRLLKMTQDGISDEEQTAITQFHDYFRGLSPSIKDEILEHGMTDYIQEVIEKEVDRINNESMQFRYSMDVFAYEHSICGFSFRVVSDTNELYKIGEDMHNCVGDYREDIVRGDSLVMTASANGQYYACLEIQGNRIVQAKGPYNEPLSGDICRAICCWSFMCQLEIDTEDLKMREEYIKEMTQSSEIVQMIQNTVLPKFEQTPLVMTVEISNKIEEAIKQKAIQMTRLSEDDAEDLENYGEYDDSRVIAWENAKSLARTLIMLKVAKGIEMQQPQKEVCRNLSA